MKRLWKSAIGGKYVIGERVGAGGMGVVHRAEQPALARTVAIKLLRRELAADPYVTARFRAEALAVAALTHPNLVTVIDYGETEDGRPYMVMEYVHGGTLGELVRTGAHLGAARVVALMRQILAGLAEAHAAGVVHADVKSDNVLVERGHDGGERIKLVDFGLARIRGSKRSGCVLGTPEYMAPEVIAGEDPTPSADLYGAGVILYELLTGAPPFTNASPSQIMRAQVESVVMPPSQRRPERSISPGLEQIVMRALAKAPGHRPADAAEFAAALAALPVGPDDRSTGVPIAIRIEEPSRGAVGTPPALCDPYLGGASRSLAARDERRLRAALAESIGGGAIDRIVRGYVALADLLGSRGAVHAAIHELETAVDLLTACEGPEAATGPLAPLVDALLPLYEEVADQRETYAHAADHWRTLTEPIDDPRAP